MQIEKLTATNLNELTHLVLELWPECSFDEEHQLFEEIIHHENEGVFLVKEQNSFIAFIQVSLRTDYVEGVTTSPVGYAEGLYVRPEHRKKGIGKQLLQYAQEWAKQKDCKEFASDAALTNQASIDFHKQVGFTEVNRIVCFVKEL